MAMSYAARYRKANLRRQFFENGTDNKVMRIMKTAFALLALILVLNPAVVADSLTELSGKLTQPLHPELEILAETVRVNVKNGAAITKVLLVLRNPAQSAVATGFFFPFTEKDTLIDFGLSRRSVNPLGSAADSFPPLAALDADAENPDSLETQPSGYHLAPGETAAVMLVYQSAPGGQENGFRYVFPLKESFKTKSAIRSFAFFADIEEKSRIMEVKTENYPIVVRGNGAKRQIYFWQNYLRPKADIGFSYRAMPPKKEL